MADTITAVFHYFENGEERRVSLDYTAENYKVVIPDIGASMLGNRYDIIVSTDNGDTTLQLSPLDYAKIILSNQDASQTEKNAMAAVYRYYEAFRDHKNS